jgi:hypothetical protein
MERKINLNGKIIGYNLKKNSRAKNISLTVSRSGQVGLTVPKYFPIFLAEKFIKEKAEWLLEKIGHTLKNPVNPVIGNKKDYLEKKENALALVEQKINHFNRFYNFDIKSLQIKNQKTRWGSCSVKKNLNFSYKLVYLPDALVDYVVVHELCHLKEMNHSARFWDLVSEAIPDWKIRRKALKGHAF